MSTPSSPPDLEFRKLNSILSLYCPDPTAPISPNDPTTIIFCQWSGVHPGSRLLNSFYTKYHSLYPNARIIAVRSPAKFFISTSTAARRLLIKPIISAIEADPAPERRILVHLLSNGGALSLADVCHTWKEHSGSIFPIEAIFFDSAPGEPSIRNGFNAAAISLPKGIMWYPMAAVVTLFLGILMIKRDGFGIPTLVDWARTWLNDLDIVDKNAKRMYLYSEEDEVIDWRDVEKHAKEAQEKGISVVTIKEVKGGHVQHAVCNKRQYWMSVTELWANSSARL